MSEIPETSEDLLLHKTSPVELPEPGVIVKPTEFDTLINVPGLVEAEPGYYQKKFGLKKALAFNTGEVDKFGWKHTMYFLFDKDNRLVSASETEHGIPSATTYSYDEKGRLIKEERDYGTFSYETFDYEYTTESPNEVGVYLYDVNKTTRSGLRSK